MSSFRYKFSKTLISILAVVLALNPILLLPIQTAKAAAGYGMAKIVSTVYGGVTTPFTGTDPLAIPWSIKNLGVTFRVTNSDYSSGTFDQICITNIGTTVSGGSNCTTISGGIAYESYYDYTFYFDSRFVSPDINSSSIVTVRHTGGTSGQAGVDGTGTLSRVYTAPQIST
ncbi:MAG: hypothetical protein NTW50_05560 [Candidatus Berkelbacteria bacterium]|nr:hypothetical protein [Candidatus Berkelbacteria bacterium]